MNYWRMNVHAKPLGPELKILELLEIERMKIIRPKPR